MASPEIRIWHQSFTVLENLPDYAASLRAHMAKVSRPGTKVELHGMHPATYASEYPGNDIRHSYLYFLHANQFVTNGLAAQQQGYDAYAISTGAVALITPGLLTDLMGLSALLLVLALQTWRRRRSVAAGPTDAARTARQA